MGNKENIKDNSLAVKIFIGIFTAIVSTLLISIFIMIVGMRDSVDYIIPFKNQQQDTSIHILHLNDTKLDKKCKKNNIKIDSIAKGTMTINDKLDKILKNQKTFNKRQIFIFKNVKDLKQYSGLLTEKQIN